MIIIPGNNHKYLCALAGVCLLSLAGCSEWTEPQSVEIKVPTLESQNPELYAQYLQSLREYRSSDHKVMIAKFDNVPGAPSGRAEHLNCLPDSVDYVILNNPDNLSDAMVTEMDEIRQEKGMKTMYTVSYDTIEDEYKVYVEEWNAAHAPETGEGGEEPQAFDDFLAQRADYYLSLSDKYSYDGIVVGYEGVFPGSLQDEAKAELLASQTVFFDKVRAWKESHPQSLFFFEGIPVNMLYDRAVINDADYIIIPAENQTNINGFTFSVEMAMTEDVPAEMVVIGVTMPSLVDDGSTDGLMSATDADGNSVYAVAAAAEWSVIPYAGFDKAGICVDRSQNDYFDINKAYRHIREAIAQMNPSPIN